MNEQAMQLLLLSKNCEGLKRVSYNGITPASQAGDDGSIPFTRSNHWLF